MNRRRPGPYPDLSGFRVADAARELQLSRQTLYNCIYSGKLRATVCFGHWWITGRELERFKSAPRPGPGRPSSTARAKCRKRKCPCPPKPRPQKPPTRGSPQLTGEDLADFIRCELELERPCPPKPWAKKPPQTKWRARRQRLEPSARLRALAGLPASFAACNPALVRSLSG